MLYEVITHVLGGDYRALEMWRDRVPRHPLPRDRLGLIRRPLPLPVALDERRRGGIGALQARDVRPDDHGDDGRRHRHERHRRCGDERGPTPPHLAPQEPAQADRRSRARCARHTPRNNFV